MEEQAMFGTSGPWPYASAINEITGFATTSRHSGQTEVSI
jgi:hypothetical protein